MTVGPDVPHAADDAAPATVSDGSVDLDNCAREPIHIPGAVQPYGVLLVVREPGLDVAATSDSITAHLGVAPEAALGRPLLDLFDGATGERVRAALGVASLRAVNPVHMRTVDGRSFEAVLHRPPAPAHVLVVELEPVLAAYGAGGPTFDPRLRAAIVRLQGATDAASLTRTAAEEIRGLTGFDRVMIYEFDDDWNGAVIAESRRDDLDSFLGQHYPASDIPAQARRLYELNWLRLIADATYTPSPLLGLTGDDGPLDMSFAVLRSVSPIHLEYLANMGVKASMSISLLRDGKLIGLIACHHYQGSHLVPFATRETTEYLGQTLSWHLDVLRTALLAESARRVQEHEGEIVRAISSSGEMLDGLAIPSLVELPGAVGASVVLAEGTRHVGQVPAPEQIGAIVAHLRVTDSDVFATNHLSREIPEAVGWDVAGVLAVAISRELGEYVLWYRPQAEQVIDWAGNPHHTKLTQGEGRAPRLSPRGSFELWREVVRGHSTPWRAWEVQGASSLRRVLLGGIRRRAAELRALNDRLVEADRAKDDFIATVSHELRTPLNAIGGWTTLLRSGSLPPDKIAHAIEVIARNVDAQSQLVEDLLDVSRMASGKLTLDVESVDLRKLVESVVESMVVAIEARAISLTTTIDARAQTVLGDPTRLRQVATNLLSNAVKFTPKGGRIRIGLERNGGDVELVVADSGRGIPAAFLPHVFEAFRQADAGMNRRSQGLGLGLAIVRKLVELHGGLVTAESDGEGKGATFRVALPLATRPSSATSSTGIATPIPSTLPPLAMPAELAALRVLLVDDDDDARDLVLHVLVRCGAHVTSARNGREALAQLDVDAGRFDVLVSDIGMPDMDGFDLVAAVRLRDAAHGGRLPAVALTAYTRAVDRTRALQAGFQAHVPKPVDPNELVAVLASVVRRP